MATLPLRSRTLREQAGVVRDALRLMEVSPRELVLPSVLGVVTTVLRLATLALFLPLVHGLLANDFSRLDRFLPLRSWIGQRGYGEMVAMLCVGVLAIALLRATCAYVAGQVVARRVEWAQNRLSEIVLRKHLRFGQQFYDLKRSGAIVRQIHRLATRAERLLLFIDRSFNAVASLSLYLLALSVISLPLTLGAVVVLGGYVFIFGRLVDRIDDATERIEEAEDEVYASVQDVVSNLPLVKLSGQQQAEVEDLRRLNAVTSQVRLEEGRITGWIDPLRDFFDVFVLLFFVAICAVVLRGIELGQISRFLVFFLIFRRAMNSFSTIQNVPVEWKKLVYRLELMFQAIDDSDKHVVPDGTREFEGLRRGIEVRDLDFAYLKKGRVLEGVSLDLPRGQRTFVVGATGSGKSTLFRLLLRLYDCPPGAIRVDGVDLREYRIGSWLDRVAFAGSDPLFFNQSIRHNVTYGLGPVNEAALREAARRAQALEFIERLESGFEEVIGDRGTRLSSGEQQRLALVRIFLSDPELILLDEGTSALDGATEASVLAELEEFAAERTLVVIAHRLSNLQAHDRVVVFDHGRVIEQGWRDDLLAAGGGLARLWRAQNLASGEESPEGRSGRTRPLGAAAR